MLHCWPTNEDEAIEKIIKALKKHGFVDENSTISEIQDQHLNLLLNKQARNSDTQKQSTRISK